MRTLHRRHHTRLLFVFVVVFAFVPLLLTRPASGASGTAILVYNGNDALNGGYTHFGMSIGFPVVTLDTLPTDLSSYACIILPVNRIPFSASQKAILSAYVEGGGNLIAIGEHALFTTANATMNDLARTLGGSMGLANDAIDGGVHATDQIDASPLTVGVYKVGYAGTNTVNFIEPAQSLVRTSLTSDKPGSTFIAAQPVGAGTFVLLGDAAVFSDSTYAPDFYLKYDNGDLAENVCLKSLTAVEMSYTAVPMYDPGKANTAGSTVPVMIQITDENGMNVSDAGLMVRAVSLTMGTERTAPVPSPGRSQPDGAFRFDPALGDGGGYLFNVKTTGLAPGRWKLNFTVGDDPTIYRVPLVVR